MSSAIEWENEAEVRPQAGDLAEFCRLHGLPPIAPSSDSLQVFISEPALDGLLAFLSDETTREHGGVLVGLPYLDPASGALFIDIQAALPALYTQGSAVHLQFTPETWDFVSGLIADEYPHLVVVGWFHSHPGLGVFLSSTDRATQRAFFNRPWSLALVVDPLARTSGWFSGAEAQALGRGQVQPYRFSPAELQPAAVFQSIQPSAAEEQLEQEYFARRPDYRWLLPLALLIAAAGWGLAWLAVRRGCRKGRIGG